MRRILLVFLAACALGILLGYAISPALAQGETPEAPTDNEVNAVARDLYCPVCENVPLDVCPSLACQQWRAQIADLLAQGLSKEEIQAYFVEYYGDQVLAAPPARGLNWLVYVLPPLLVLGGGYWLARRLRQWRAPEEDPTLSAAPPEPVDEYEAQIERELEARR